MKALLLESNKTLVYKDVEEVKPGENEVKIKIEAAGICGSDIHGYDGSSGRRIPPIIMGHEGAGIITETGRDIKEFKVGDRVTFDSTIFNQDDWFTKNGFYNLSEHRRVLGVSCTEYKQDGIFAEFVVLPEHILHKIPRDVSFDEAALTEPLAVGVHAVNISQAQTDNSTMVVGAGIIGLMILQVLVARGYQNIVVADIDSDKLKLAAKLGAFKTLNPEIDDVQDSVRKMTEFRGIDIVFEAVGLQKTIDLSFQAVRKGGTVTLVGNITPQVQMPLQQIVTHQIKIQGSCAICGEYTEALQLLSEKKIATDIIISKTAHLSEGQEWFDRLYEKEKGLLKVILKP